MSDFDAVSALLMLSTGIQSPAAYPQPTVQQLPRPASQPFGFYTENQENAPQDLSLLKPKRDMYNTNRPRTTSTPLKPINGNNFNAFEPFPYVDHSYAAGAANTTATCPTSSTIQPEQSIDLNSFQFGGDTSSVTDDRSYILPAPSLPTWVSGDPRQGLTPAVTAEFDKILRYSSHVKDEYMQRKAKESPMEFEYNPKKSRLRKVYKDPEEAAGRAKNNLASRKSRQKKKLQMQLLNFSLAFDREENRQLYAQERWMADVIADLEDKLLAKGYDAIAIRQLRAQCGMK